MKTTPIGRALLGGAAVFAALLVVGAVIGMRIVSHALAVFVEHGIIGAPAVPSYVERYTQSILGGGPIFFGLHIAIAVAFPSAIIAAIRRASTLVTSVLCIAPFVLGATAMWVSSIGLLTAATDFDRCGGIHAWIPDLPMAFHLGTALSVTAFAISGLCHALQRSA